MKPKNRTVQHLGLIALAFAFAGNAARATPINWNGATTGLWSATGSWSTSTVPTSSDDLTILGPSNVAGALTINFDTNGFANSISVTNTAATALTNTTSGSDKTLTLGTGGLTTGTGAVAIGSGTTNQKINIALAGNQTWNVGSGGLTATNVISGTGFSLAKSGAGTLTLSGANTYSGGTTINAGTLLLGNNTAAGSGTIDLAGSTLGASAALTNVANTVNVTGTSTLGQNSNFALTLSGPLTGAGTLQNKTTTGSSPNVFFTGNLSGFTGALAFTNTASNASATWRFGATGGKTIDLSNATVNLIAGASSNVSFGFVDAITVANTMKIGALTGSGTFQGSFNGTAFNILEVGNLNTSSTFSGVLGRSTSNMMRLNLTKVGTGTLTLSGVNINTGATTINAGTLSVSSLANGGSNSNIGASTNVAGNLVLNGGTLEYTGAVVSTDRLFSLQSSSAIDASGSGAVNFTNTGSMGFNGGTAAKTLTLTGSSTGANTLAALIGDNTGVTSVTKSGGGSWTLSGTHTYTGNTTVNAGKLVVNGNSSTSALTTVNSTATLGGSGTVGALTVMSGGTLAPGNSPGILSAGNTDLQASSTLGIEINGSTLGTGYDQLNIAGTVSLAGALSVSLGGFTPVNSTLFFILANDGADAVAGTFSNASTNGATYTFDGQDFQISYFGDSTGGTFTGGNDVALMAVPEPGAVLLGGLGMLALLRRRRVVR